MPGMSYADMGDQISDLWHQIGLLEAGIAHRDRAISDLAQSLADVVAQRDALRLGLDRWQDVAFVDGADITARARQEGIAIETGREPAFREFIQQFQKKASAYR